MIVTIDGHAGSGKSTAARTLARQLGFELLNTGAMYRATAWFLAGQGIDLARPDADTPDLERLCGTLTFEFPAGRVHLNGCDVTDHIFTEECGRAASLAGTFRPIRRRLQAEQRRQATGRDLVAEGRDQGSVVFPEAEVKFFLTASPELRARRRLAQLNLAESPEAVARLAQEIQARDRQDAGRTLDPLVVPAGAVVIDTTTVPADGVVQQMLAAVNLCRAT